MAEEAWIAVGAALLGAVVGGAASLGGSIAVDWMRLRRETRIRLYDDYIPDAQVAVGRWRDRSQGGAIDLENEQALSALAQVHRAIVIAGKSDRRQVAAWSADYEALRELGSQIRTVSDGQGGWSITRPTRPVRR